MFCPQRKERCFALELGAAWAGGIDDKPPHKLESIIDTTPAWRPVLTAMGNLLPGGRLVINAIRKEGNDSALLAGLDYSRQLWMEKEIKSVANVTRSDVSAFLRLASEVPLRPVYQEYPLTEANQALRELKERRIRGAKVLRVRE